MDYSNSKVKKLSCTTNKEKNIPVVLSQYYS
jgi:hypothetical protein